MEAAVALTLAPALLEEEVTEEQVIEDSYEGHIVSSLRWKEHQLWVKSDQIISARKHKSEVYGRTLPLIKASLGGELLGYILSMRGLSMMANP